MLGKIVEFHLQTGELAEIIQSMQKKFPSWTRHLVQHYFYQPCNELSSRTLTILEATSIEPMLLFSALRSTQ